MDATSLGAESVTESSKRCDYLLPSIVCTGLGVLISGNPALGADSLCSQVLSYAG